MNDDESRGLLTESERKTLAGETDAGPDRDEVLNQVRDRLSATLADCMVLYPALREADIEAVFCSDDDSAQSIVRAGTQDALALLVLGMLANDDMLESRLTEAIQHAGLAYGEEMSVDLELRRGPVPTVEQFVARCESDGFSMSDLTLYEHLLWNSDTDPEQLAAMSQQVGLESSLEEIHELRDAAQRFARRPQTAVTSVEVETGSEDSL